MKYNKIYKKAVESILIGVLFLGAFSGVSEVRATNLKVTNEVSGEDSVNLPESTEANLEDIKTEIYDKNTDEIGQIENIKSELGQVNSNKTRSISAIGTLDDFTNMGDIRPVINRKENVEIFNNAINENMEISTDIEVVTGKLGENVRWELNLNTGALLVQGTGAISNYASSPWADYADSVQMLKIESGITEIGAYAFSKLTNLIEVEIDDEIEKIGFRAFANCVNLTTINIPLNWKECPSGSTAGTIDVDYCGHIFEGCKQLTNIVVPEGMTELPGYAFAYCDYLENVELPSTLKGINNHTFFECGKLKEIDIPEGVTYIKKSAFCYCDSLQNVRIPEGVTELYLYAFYNCASLTEVQMANSIEKIGYKAFADCTSLTTINISLNWNECPSGSTSGTIDVDYCGHIFEGCKQLINIVVPEGMTELPGYAFAYCDYLENVELPSTLKGINNHTFFECGKLKEIDIPEGVTYIKKSAFCYCDSLQNVRIPEGVTELYLYAFYSCGSLTEVQLANSIEKIGYKAFADCTSLTMINIPLNWKECPSGSTAGTIDADYCGHIFEGCKQLTNIVVPEGMTELPGYAFAYCDYLENVELPSTLKGINNHTFFECGKLKEIDIPEGVTYIKKSAFCYCDSLQNVRIPEGVTELYLYAFYSCGSLTEVQMANGIEKIGYKAFADCTSLTTVNIPLNWKECPSGSTSGTVNTSYCGYIFEGCEKLLNVIVPEGMRELPSYAFASCNYLANISLPSTLEKIGNYAFYSCQSLLSVEIPAKVQSIPEYTFYGCSALQVINLPEDIESIEKNAFKNCNTISKINYAGAESDYNRIQINSTGNSLLGEVSVIYDFTVTYTPDDFVGIWDGEYDGSSGSRKVRRHFVFVIEECKPLDENAAKIIGKRTISQSLEDASEYYAEGSDFVEGIVNLKTGAMSFQGSYWIEYPVGPTISSNNFNHMKYEGFLEVNKISMSGINGGDTSRTYYANLVGTVSASTTTVSLLKDGISSDIIKNTYNITENSEEVVTIIVSPDWNDETPGTIRMFQKDIALESKSGVFLDIKPGKVFNANENIYVGLVNTNGDVIETRKISLKVIIESSSRLNTTLENVGITVYQNKNSSSDTKDKYVLSKGAMVVVGNNTYTTQDNGTATIKIIPDGSFVVTKDNYISRTLKIEQLSENKEVYLQKKNSKAPVISGVWVENTDVLHFPYALSMLSTDEITLNAEVDWGSGSAENIQLVQEAKSINFAGESLTTVISDKFDTSKTIYIVATDSAGNTTRRPIKIQNSSVNKTVEWLEKAELDFSDEISIKLPSNMKPSFLAEMELGVGLATATVPITVSAEDGKVSIVFGVELVGMEYEKTTYKKGGSYTKTTVNHIIKEFKQSGFFGEGDIKDSIKDLKNLKKLYNKQIKTYKGKLGVDADFTVMGFAEGTYDAEGKFKFLDGGLILNPSVSVEKDFPFGVPVGPVVIPLFFETEFSADVEAKMNLLMREAARKFSPEGELKGDVALSGGLGLGVSKVLYASGGLEGKLNPLWRIYLDEPDYFKLTASLSGYAKAGIACFEGKLPIPLIKDAVWYETKPSKSVNVNTTNATYSGLDYEALYDTSNYELKDLSYVAQGSEFVANTYEISGRISTFASTPEILDEIEVKEFKTNIYKESTPKIVTLDGGKKLAVWIDTASTDINQVYLYYSYYDGAVWSEPQIVHKDGTMDYSPELVKVGDTVYLAWQNASRKFVESAELTLEDIAGDFDISVASFDVTAKAFECDTIASAGLDMSPALCGEGENVIVVWINNGADDWFGANDQNSIMYSELTAEGWSEAMTAYEGLYSVNSVAVDYQNELNIAYCLDTDGNIETSEDLRVYENGMLVSAGSYAQSLPQYVDHELYWYSQSNVVSKEITETAGNLVAANYQVLNVNGQQALIYTLGEGLNSKVMMSYLNADTLSWDEGIQITEGNDFIGAYHATVEGGNVTILVNNTKITGDYTSEEPYGESRLMLVEIPEYCDLSLGEIYYAEDAFCAGEKMPFIIELTNEGTTMIEETTVEIQDEQGNVLNVMSIQDIIAPGETLDTQVYYEIGTEVTEQEIRIIATPANLSDIHEEDNEKNVELTYERVFVENLGWGYKEDKTVVVTADIVNRGYHTWNNLLVSLIKDSVNGEIIEAKEVSSVEPLDLSTVSFDIKAEESDVYYVVITQKNDTETLDQDFVAIYSDASGANVTRIFGSDRYSTGYKVADVFKGKIAVDKFDAVVVATGKNFADALSGSYLSVVKDAPILLTNGKADNVKKLHDYIKANVNAGGTIYILGGEAAVPKSVESINGYTVKRLSGSTRYDTNIEILKEAGVTGDKIIVATGKSFADSLSASATKLPILLVRPGKTLDAEQKTILVGMNNIYIVGGDGAVSENYENELASYGKVNRVSGATRYETSIAVANTFFDDVNTAVVASGKNFPDGLCGGSLAAAMNAPLILSVDGKTAAASKYVQEEGIRFGHVLGGVGALKDETVVEIFGLDYKDEINIYVEEETEENKQPEVDEENNQEPVGAFEWGDGNLHNIYVNGWAEDPDTPDQSVEVRVYIDGKYVKSLLADVECHTVECGCGKLHEFVEEISYPVTEQREYTISIYAVDTQSGAEVLIGEQREIIYMDITSPKVTNVTVSDVSATGYTITCDVTDNTGVGRVRFFTWKAEEGMDFDGGAYPDNWETGSEYLGTIDGDRVTYRVNIPQVTNDEVQLYRTDIYAEDVYGRTMYVPVVASVGGSVFTPLVTAAYNGHTYAMYDIPLEMCAATVPWSYAKTYAESIGGYLVTITSEEEWQAMKPLMEAARADVWLGATDEEELGTWKWITGEEFSYSAWENGYPKTNEDEKDEQYYLIVDPDTMKWSHEMNPLWLEVNNFIVEFEGDYAF